jgi:hypothetical protein
MTWAGSSVLLLLNGPERKSSLDAMISEESIVGKTPATAMIVINSSWVNAFWALAEANKDKYLQNLRFI